MASGFLNNLFGSAKPSATDVPSGDSDFADFAGAPDPEPVSFAAASNAASSGFQPFGASPTGTNVPWTKWYNVHERHSLEEFKTEGMIFGIIFLIVIIHLLGAGTNRKKAKQWISALAPTLREEFALVGFGGRRGPTADEIESEGLAKALASADLDLPEELLKEKSLQEFASYATGRQNVAFLDLSLSLKKWYSPLTMLFEYAFSLFFESMPAPTERFEAFLVPFDGREAQSVPGQLPGSQELRKDTKSSYDGFVWAVVNKDTMKVLRDERYDVSITTTKDHSKLPGWVTVMSESAEVTDLLLTPELIKAIESAGELLQHLIITDQPVDQPLTLDACTPKKRIYLSMRLPASGDYSSILPLFQYFVCLTDFLVQSAHFRPEVIRKVKATRESTINKLKKADEDEKAEERAAEREKAKKTKREMELKGLDAKAQKKYLAKEQEKEQKRNQKKMTQRA